MSDNQDASTANAAGFGSAGDDRADSPQATALRAMVSKAGIKHVNGFLNIGFIAGWAIALDGQTMLLQQTENPEQGLRIKVDTKKRQIPKESYRPVVAKVHIRAGEDEFGYQAVAHCIGVDRPSQRDMPEQHIWVSGFGRGAKSLQILRAMSAENFNPFRPDGTVKDDYADFVVVKDGAEGERGFELNSVAMKYTSAYRMYADVIEASGGVVDSRLGKGQNYVALAGVVDSRMFVPANEHRSAYGLIMLRQSNQDGDLIPVRIRGPKAEAVARSVHPGKVIVVEGSLRRKVYPKDDDPEQVASAHSFVETTGVASAVFEKDVLVMPDWWRQIAEREAKARAARRAALAAAAAAEKTPIEEVDRF